MKFGILQTFHDTFQKTEEPLNSSFRLSTSVISFAIQDIKMDINRNQTLVQTQTRPCLLPALHTAVRLVLDCQILALTHGVPRSWELVIGAHLASNHRDEQSRVKEFSTGL